MFEETYGLPSTIALNTASKDYHMNANGGVLSPRGLMLLGQSGEDDAFEADKTTMKMEEISIRDAVDLVPILKPEALARVGHHTEAWDIDTDLLIQNFARELRRNGGTICTSAKVMGIVKTPKVWHVTAGGQTHDARILVNAAGAWADVIADMAGVAPIGITAFRRSMARLAAPGGHDVRSWPMMFGTGESWYAKPDAGGLLVSPADEDPTHPHDAFADDLVLAEGLDRYQGYVTEPVTRPIASWAGLRSFAPDRNLVIGFDPDTPSFFWQAGQGGYGFQTCPAASQLAADLVAGTTPGLDAHWVAALSPSRLR